jgi:hypothetical protein
MLLGPADGVLHPAARESGILPLAHIMLVREVSVRLSHQLLLILVLATESANWRRNADVPIVVSMASRLGQVGAGRDHHGIA